MGSGAELNGAPQRPGSPEASLNQLTRRAHGHLDKGNVEKAMELFQSAVEQSRSTGDPRSRISCSLNAGACLVSLGRYEEGIGFLEYASRVMKSAGSADAGEAADNSHDADVSTNVTLLDDMSDSQTLGLSADVFFNLGVAMRALRKCGSAAAHFRSCIELYTRAGSKRHAAEGLVSLSKCHRDVREVEQEIACLTNAQLLYGELGDCGSEALVFIDLSRAYLNLGKREESRQMLSTAKMMCLRVDDPQVQGKLHAQFGLVYSSLHLFEEAIQSFERALPLIRIGKSSTALQTEASLLQNIGAAYNERGFYSEAVIYHREAAALHGRANNFISEAKCLCNLAYAQTQLNNYSSSAESFTKALGRAGAANNPYLQFQSAEGLAASSYHLGQYNAAIKHFNLALTLLDQIGEDTGMARERVMEKLSDAREALQVLKQKRAQHSASLNRHSSAESDTSDEGRNSVDSGPLEPATIRDMTPVPHLHSLAGSSHSLDIPPSSTPPPPLATGHQIAPPLARRLSPELSTSTPKQKSRRTGHLPPSNPQESPDSTVQEAHLSIGDQPGLSGVSVAIHPKRASKKHAIPVNIKKGQRHTYTPPTAKGKAPFVEQADSYDGQLQAYVNTYREEPSLESSSSDYDSLPGRSHGHREEQGASVHTQHVEEGQQSHKHNRLPRKLSPLSRPLPSLESSPFASPPPGLQVQEGSLAIGPNARDLFTTRTHLVKSGQRRKSKMQTEIVPISESHESSSSPQPPTPAGQQPSKVCAIL